MEIQTEIIETTIEAVKPYESLSVGGLPVGGGMTMNIASGAYDTEYMDTSATGHLTLLMLCKDKSRQAFDRLSSVCNRLKNIKNPPNITGGQLLRWEIDSTPQFVSKDTLDGLAVYSAVVKAHYHQRKENE